MLPDHLSATHQAAKRAADPYDTRPLDRPTGRPHLDGSPPGEGEYTVTKCITLTPTLAAYLKRVGGGNLSRGVRVVAHYYEETENERPRSQR